MGEVIAFFGGDSQVGLTLLTASIAQGLKTKAKKCLVLFASLEVEEAYFPQEKAGNLGTLLRLSKVEKNEAEAVIEEGKDFDYIKGPSDLLKKQFFDPGLLDRLIDLVSNRYDFILIDAGHDVTLPLCAASLSAANRRYYVLTGSEKCINRYKASYSSVIEGLGLNTNRDKLIVNKENKKTSTYLTSEVCTLLGKEGFAVPFYEYPMRCEVDKDTAFSRDSLYQKAVLAIVNDILEIEPKKKK